MIKRFAALAILAAAIAAPAHAQITSPWEGPFYYRNIDLGTDVNAWIQLPTNGADCLLVTYGSGPDVTPGGLCATFGAGLTRNGNVIDVVTGKAVVGTAVKTNSFRTYKNATVSGGTAVFHLTADGTSTGTALYAEVFTDSVQLIVNDASASYQMAWAFSNGNRTLTVTANRLTTANLLTGVLGQTQANGAVVRLSVEGK